MVLVGIAYTGILAELLIRPIIGINPITTPGSKPRLGGFDTEVVVLVLSKLAPAVGTLQNALCQGDGSRDAVPFHLLNSKFLILVYVLLGL